MSAYFNTQKQQGFRDFIPQQSGKGRICSISSISRQLIKAHYDGYHPRMSRQLATALKRYINTRPKYERRTPEFVEEIRRKILCLHEYNLQIARVKFKYPRSEQFDVVLMQYVELECGLLYDTYSDVDKEHENQVTQRVLRLLRVILHDALQSTEIPLKTTMESCDKSLLKLFVNVRADYVSENKLVASTITKLLHKLRLLEDVDKLKGKNIAFQEDTFLRSPLVCSIRQNLATSDYESDMDDEDDDDLSPMMNEPLGNSALTPQGLFSHLEEKVNIMRTSKHFDNFSFKLGPKDNNLSSSLFVQKIEKESVRTSYQNKQKFVENGENVRTSNNSIDSSLAENKFVGASEKLPENCVNRLPESNLHFLRIDRERNAQNKNCNSLMTSSSASFLKHSVTNKLNKPNVPSTFITKQSSGRNEDFFLATDGRMSKESTKQNSFSRNDETQKKLEQINIRQDVLTTSNEKSQNDNSSKRTQNLEEVKSSCMIAEDIREQQDKLQNEIVTPNIEAPVKIQTVLNHQPVRTTSTDKNIAQSPVSMTVDCEIIDLDEDSSEVPTFSRDIASKIKTEVPSFPSASDEFYRSNPVPSFESFTPSTDCFQNNSFNNRLQATENLTGGIITIEILDDDENDYNGFNSNSTEDLSQFGISSSNLLQSNEIKQEENEENRSPNFSIPSSDNDDQNFWGSGKSTRNSNSTGLNKLGKGTNKDSTREADPSAIIISDSEDEVVDGSSACNEELLDTNRNNLRNELHEHEVNEGEVGIQSMSSVDEVEKNEGQQQEETHSKDLDTKELNLQIHELEKQTEQSIELNVPESALPSNINYDKQVSTEHEVAETPFQETVEDVEEYNVADMIAPSEGSLISTSGKNIQTVDSQEDKNASHVNIVEENFTHETELTIAVSNENMCSEILTEEIGYSSKEDFSHFDEPRIVDQNEIGIPTNSQIQVKETDVSKTTDNSSVIDYAELNKAITFEPECTSEHLHQETREIVEFQELETVEPLEVVVTSESSTVHVEVEQPPMSEIIPSVEDVANEISGAPEIHGNEVTYDVSEITLLQESQEIELEVQSSDKHQNLEVGEKENATFDDESKESVNENDVEQSRIDNSDQNQIDCAGNVGLDQRHTSSDFIHTEVTGEISHSVDILSTECITVTNEFSEAIESEVTTYEEKNCTSEEPTCEPVQKETMLEVPGSIVCDSIKCSIAIAGEEFINRDQSDIVKEITHANQVEIVDGTVEDVEDCFSENIDTVEEITESSVSENIETLEETKESSVPENVDTIEEIKESSVIEHVEVIEETKKSAFSESTDTVQEVKESSVSENIDTAEKIRESSVKEHVEAVEETKSCSSENADNVEEINESSVAGNADTAEEISESSVNEHDEVVEETKKSCFSENADNVEEINISSVAGNADTVEEISESSVNEHVEVVAETKKSCFSENADTVEKLNESSVAENADTVEIIKASSVTGNLEAVEEIKKSCFSANAATVEERNESSVAENASTVEIIKDSSVSGNLEAGEERKECCFSVNVVTVEEINESSVSESCVQDPVVEPQENFTSKVLPENNEYVQEVTYEAIDYSVNAQYAQQPSDNMDYANQPPQEDTRYQQVQHNLPVYGADHSPPVLDLQTQTSNNESSMITTQSKETSLSQNVESKMPHLSIYGLPPTLTEVEYNEYNVQKKVGGDLELLANIAADQETLAVKTDSEKEVVDTASEAETQMKLSSAQSTPKRRKSKVKFECKKKTLGRETLPRAVKGSQRRNVLKPKPNTEETENKRVTRNMGIKSKTDVNVLKEVQKQPRANRNDDAKYKPHDFISLENSILPPRTNNVYAQKRLIETNTTSEDSNDSCESTLFIDLGEIQKHSEKIIKSVYEEDTICDMLEFVSTEDKTTVCISIPENEESCVSQSFHILKQMEDFVDNNNKKTPETIPKIRNVDQSKVSSPTSDESIAEVIQDSKTTIEDLSSESTIEDLSSKNTFEDLDSENSIPTQGTEEGKMIKTTDHSIENILNKVPSNGEVKVALQSYRGEIEFEDGLVTKSSVEKEQLPSQKPVIESEKKKVSKMKNDIGQNYNIPTIEVVVSRYKKSEEKVVSDNKNAKTKKRKVHNVQVMPEDLTIDKTTLSAAKLDDAGEKIFKTKAAMKAYEDKLQPQEEIGMRTRLRSRSTEVQNVVRFDRSRSSSVDFNALSTSSESCHNQSTDTSGFDESHESSDSIEVTSSSDSALGKEVIPVRESQEVDILPNHVDEKESLPSKAEVPINDSSQAIGSKIPSNSLDEKENVSLKLELSTDDTSAIQPSISPKQTDQKENLSNKPELLFSDDTASVHSDIPSKHVDERESLTVQIEVPPSEDISVLNLKLDENVSLSKKIELTVSNDVSELKSSISPKHNEEESVSNKVELPISNDVSVLKSNISSKHDQERSVSNKIDLPVSSDVSELKSDISSKHDKEESTSNKIELAVNSDVSELKSAISSKHDKEESVSNKIELTVSSDVSELTSAISSKHDREQSNKIELTVSSDVSELKSAISSKHDKEESVSNKIELTVSSDVSELKSAILSKHDKEESMSNKIELTVNSDVSELKSAISSKHDKEESVSNKIELTVSSDVSELKSTDSSKHDKEESMSNKIELTVSSDVSELESAVSSKHDKEEDRSNKIELTVSSDVSELNSAILSKHDEGENMSNKVELTVRDDTLTVEPDTSSEHIDERKSVSSNLESPDSSSVQTSEVTLDTPEIGTTVKEPIGAQKDSHVMEKVIKTQNDDPKVSSVSSVEDVIAPLKMDEHILTAPTDVVEITVSTESETPVKDENATHVKKNTRQNKESSVAGKKPIPKKTTDRSPTKSKTSDGLKGRSLENTIKKMKEKIEESEKAKKGSSMHVPSVTDNITENSSESSSPQFNETQVLKSKITSRKGGELDKSKESLLTSKDLEKINSLQNLPDPSNQQMDQTQSFKDNSEIEKKPQNKAISEEPKQKSVEINKNDTKRKRSRSRSKSRIADRKSESGADKEKSSHKSSSRSSSKSRSSDKRTKNHSDNDSDRKRRSKSKSLDKDKSLTQEDSNGHKKRRSRSPLKPKTSDGKTKHGSSETISSKHRSSESKEKSGHGEDKKDHHKKGNSKSPPKSKSVDVKEKPNLPDKRKNEEKSKDKNETSKNKSKENKSKVKDETNDKLKPNSIEIEKETKNTSETIHKVEHKSSKSKAKRHSKSQESNSRKVDHGEKIEDKASEKHVEKSKSQNSIKTSDSAQKVIEKDKHRDSDRTKSKDQNQETQVKPTHNDKHDSQKKDDHSKNTEKSRRSHSKEKMKTESSSRTDKRERSSREKHKEDRKARERSGDAKEPESKRRVKENEKVVAVEQKQRSQNNEKKAVEEIVTEEQQQRSQDNEKKAVEKVVTEEHKQRSQDNEKKAVEKVVTEEQQQRSQDNEKKTVEKIVTEEHKQRNEDSEKKLVEKIVTEEHKQRSQDNEKKVVEKIVTEEHKPMSQDNDKKTVEKIVAEEPKQRAQDEEKKAVEKIVTEEHRQRSQDNEKKAVEKVVTEEHKQRSQDNEKKAVKKIVTEELKQSNQHNEKKTVEKIVTEEHKQRSQDNEQKAVENILTEELQQRSQHNEQKSVENILTEELQQRSLHNEKKSVEKIVTEEHKQRNQDNEKKTVEKVVTEELKQRNQHNEKKAVEKIVTDEHKQKNQNNEKKAVEKVVTEEHKQRSQDNEKKAVKKIVTEELKQRNQHNEKKAVEKIVLEEPKQRSQNNEKKAVEKIVTEELKQRNQHNAKKAVERVVTEQPKQRSQHNEKKAVEKNVAEEPKQRRQDNKKKASDQNDDQNKQAIIDHISTSSMLNHQNDEDVSKGKQEKAANVGFNTTSNLSSDKHTIRTQRIEIPKKRKYKLYEENGNVLVQEKTSDDLPSAKILKIDETVVNTETSIMVHEKSTQPIKNTNVEHVPFSEVKITEEPSVNMEEISKPPTPKIIEEKTPSAASLQNTLDISTTDISYENFASGVKINSLTMQLKDDEMSPVSPVGRKDDKNDTLSVPKTPAEMRAVTKELPSTLITKEMDSPEIQNVTEAVEEIPTVVEALPSSVRPQKINSIEVPSSNEPPPETPPVTKDSPTVTHTEEINSNEVQVCDNKSEDTNLSQKELKEKPECVSAVKLLLQNEVPLSVSEPVFVNTVFRSSESIDVRVLATPIDSTVKHLPGQDADLSLIPSVSSSLSTDCITTTAVSMSCGVVVASALDTAPTNTEQAKTCLFTFNEDAGTVNRENLSTTDIFHTPIALDDISPTKLPLASNQSLDFISPSTSIAEISNSMNLVRTLGTSAINFVPDTSEIDMQQTNKQNSFGPNFVTRVTEISCFVDKESTADHNYTLGDPLLGGNNEDKNILTTGLSLSNSPEEFQLNESHLEDLSFNENNFIEENGTLEELALFLPCKKEKPDFVCDTIIDEHIPKPEDIQNSIKRLNMLVDISQSGQQKTISVDSAIDHSSTNDCSVSLGIDYAVSKLLFLGGGEVSSQNNSFTTIPDIENINIMDSSVLPKQTLEDPPVEASSEESSILAPVCSNYSSFLPEDNQKVVVEPVEQYPITSMDQLKKDYMNNTSKTEEKSKPIVKPNREKTVKTPSTFRSSRFATFLESLKKEANRNESSKAKDDMENYTVRRHNRTPVFPPKQKSVTRQHTRSPPQSKKNEILSFETTTNQPQTPSDIAKESRIRVKTDLVKTAELKDLNEDHSPLEYVNEHDHDIASEVVLPFSKPSPSTHKNEVQEKKLETSSKAETGTTKHARFDKMGNDYIMENILNVSTESVHKSPIQDAKTQDKNAKKVDSVDVNRKRKLTPNDEVKRDDKRPRKPDDELKSHPKKTDSNASHFRPTNDDIFDKLLREGPVNKVFAQRITEPQTKKESQINSGVEHLKNRGSSTVSDPSRKDRNSQPQSTSAHVHESSRVKDSRYQKKSGYHVSSSSSNPQLDRRCPEKRHIAVPVTGASPKRHIRNHPNSYSSKSDPCTTRDYKMRDRRMSTEHSLPNSSKSELRHDDDEFSWIDKFSGSGLFDTPSGLFMPPGNKRPDTSSRK